MRRLSVRSHDQDPRGSYIYLVNNITRSYGIVYTGLFYVYGATFASICMIFGALAIAPLVSRLWVKGYQTQAKMLCIVLTNYYIFTASLGLNHQVGAEYFYLTSIMLPLLFFDAFEIWKISFGFLFPVLCALMQFLGGSIRLSADLAPEAFPYELFKVMSFWAAFFATAVFVGVYNKLMKRLTEQAIEIERSSREQLIQSAKMSSLGEMAGGIAHEINNPLAIIYGRAGLMKKRVVAGNLNAELLQTDLVKIEDTARRITKIIKGLRSFSRNSEGDPMERARIKAVIEDVLELCREKLRNASIDLRLDCRVDFHIECRPSQIVQILMNLILNSYDAVEALDEKWIEIVVLSTGSSAVVKVVDSGRGISPHVLPKMMQPFFTTKEVGRGTGLGLSISKGIAEEHGGSLSYVDGPNTTFVLELPFSQRAKGEGRQEANQVA